MPFARQKREQESIEREQIRKQKKRLDRLEKEKIKESKKAVQDAKKTAKDTEKGLRPKLKDLTYKTERECLNILGKNPDDKKAFDNLVKLYILRDELVNKARELYKNKDYERAIREYKKVLLLEPENKKAKAGIKRAQSQMK